MALSVLKTYPYHLNKTEVNSIIEQAEILGIDRSTLIDEVKAYSLTLDGQLAYARLKFKSSNTSPVEKQQHNLYCEPQKQDLSQLTCQKHTHNFLKLNSSNQEWIEFKTPYEFNYDELVEVITYANKIKPVNWQGNVSYLYVKENFIFQACYSSTQKFNAYRDRCLNIKRTTKNKTNYFSVDWESTPKLSLGWILKGVFLFSRPIAKM